MAAASAFTCGRHRTRLTGRLVRRAACHHRRAAARGRLGGGEV